MPILEINDLSIAYQSLEQAEEGSVPILFLHCSSGSHRQWLPLAKTLQSDYRTFLPDFIGYGKSSRWPADKPYDPLFDVQLILKFFELAQQPLHIVAHSYGAAMALEAAKLQPEKVKSLCLIEPVSFHFLKYGQRETEWQEVLCLAKAVQSAAEQGQHKKAARRFMQYWLGWSGWLLMPKRVKQYTIETINKVKHEFWAFEQFNFEVEAYYNIHIPTQLIVGDSTRQTAKAVIEVIDEVLPNSHVEHIDKAGHMSPFTHQAQVYELATKFIKQTDAA